MASQPVADLRREYTSKGLRREDLDANPVGQFRRWFEEARAADLLEPNAMTLSTASPTGLVTSRTVLLKAYDDRGFVFFTNYGSRKAGQIAANPSVSLLFAWLPLERQVAIGGKAEKISHAESLTYFLSRPVGSRIGAWVSDQSRIISSRALLEKKFHEMMEKFRDGKVPLPDFWGGYRVVPESIEFWQGGKNRLHDRFLYERKRTPDGDSWEIQRLQP
ncbi:MAG: pyridoxamine 5'-phosphate oxidase [Terrimicrobiaceae bacterium]